MARGSPERLRDAGARVFAAALCLTCFVLCIEHPARGGAARHSETFKRLRIEYYGLLDGIEHPEKWREAVAQRRRYIAKVQAAQHRQPELRDELQTLVRRAEVSLNCDGIDIAGANAPFDPGAIEPLGGQLYVVAWVESDHLRVAVGNPAEAPRKAVVRLGQYARRKAVRDWPPIASAELELAPQEAVVVHFDGIPTTGDWRHDSRNSFQPAIDLLADGGKRRSCAIRVQHAGHWGAEPERCVVSAGKVGLIVPGRQGIAHARDFTVYVPKGVSTRRGGAAPELRPADAAALLEADHGTFVRTRAAQFQLILPQTDAMDLIRVPDLVARIHSGSIISVDRAPGPTLLLLGKATIVRRVAVALPAKNRLDREPLSDEPARRAAQLVPRLATELWQVLGNAERQIAAIGAPAVPAMVGLLAHGQADGSTPRSRFRRSAKRVLAAIGEPAVESVSRVLRSPHWQPGFDAAEVLAAIGGRGIDALLLAARASSPRTREAALHGLGKAADPRRVAVVRELLADADKAVRDRASALLPAVVKDDEAMAHILGQLDSPDPSRRQWAVYKLMEWKASGGWPPINRTQDGRAPQIIRMLEDREADVREAAASALGQLADARAAAPLIEAARDESPAVRRAVAWALNALANHRKLTGEETRRRAIAAAMALLADADESTRCSAAHILGGLEAQAAVEPLSRALDDPSPNVRQGAKSALARLGCKLEALPGEQRFRVVGKPAHAAVPDRMAGLIEQLGAGDAARRTQARDALVAVLRSPDALLARRAAEALARTPDPSLLPIWLKLLDSGDFLLRAAAAGALGRIGDRSAVPKLLARLDDPRTEVRRKVFWALGTLGDPAAVPPLFERFVNRRGGKRNAKAVYADHTQYAADLDALQQALIALGEPAADDLIRATEFGWGPLEEKARDALVKIGKPAIVPLLAALEGPDPMTKAGAARALGLLRPPEAIRPLIDVVASKGDYECTKAFEALIAYGEVARPTLKAAMKDPKLNLMGRGAAAALLMNLGDTSGFTIIASIIETRDGIEANRMANRMGMLRNRAFLPLLEKALNRPDAWQGVTYAVAYCGGKDAIPILMKALDHPNKGVQSGARRWLERLAK